MAWEYDPRTPDPAAAPSSSSSPSPRTRCTEIFTTEYTANMVRRANLLEGYAYARTDSVADVKDGEAKFLVWASMDPLPEPEVITSPLWQPPNEWGIRA